jgi:hypothetical protein
VSTFQSLRMLAGHYAAAGRFCSAGLVDQARTELDRLVTTTRVRRARRADRRAGSPAAC